MRVTASAGPAGRGRVAIQLAIPRGLATGLLIAAISGTASSTCGTSSVMDSSRAWHSRTAPRSSRVPSSVAVLATFVTPLFVLPLPAPWVLRQSVWSLRRRRMLPDPLVIVLAHDGVARLIAAKVRRRIAVVAYRNAQHEQWYSRWRHQRPRPLYQALAYQWSA